VTTTVSPNKIDSTFNSDDANAGQTTNAVSVSNLNVSFGARAVLAGLSMTIEEGEAVAIMGPSGSGKTTLLKCVSGLVRPDSGDITVNGEEVTKLNSRRRARLRRTVIGQVFQFGDLLPELTVEENVGLPFHLAGQKPSSSEVAKALQNTGMYEQRLAWPANLSGGETQRTAVARAIVTAPKLLLCDEPTGSLDEENSARVVDLLRSVARTRETALVVSTHDLSVARQMDRILVLRHGRLVVARP
jgi:putative ABC transport system ATP-binding protein